MTLKVGINRDERLDPGPVPVEALEYFAEKALEPGFSFEDVWAEEHHRAFTAAKFMREDVLEALKTEIERAIEEGVPFREFADTIAERFARMGWWGKQTAIDPLTGRAVEVDVPSRLRLIYDTNMRTAMAAGQWERIERTTETHPFLLYELGPSSEHRLEHMGWHGLMLPANDPFWEEHFPPNGYGCKCHVRQISRREAARVERDGLRAPQPRPELDADGVPTGHVEDDRVKPRTTAPQVERVPYTNKRTGKTEMVPRGVDPGFHRPPSSLKKPPVR